MKQDRAAPDRQIGRANDDDPLDLAPHDFLTLQNYNPFRNSQTKSKNTHAEGHPELKRVTSAFSESYLSTETEHHQRSVDFESISVPQRASTMPSMGIGSSHSISRSSPDVDAIPDVESAKSVIIPRGELPPKSAISRHCFAIYWNHLKYTQQQDLWGSKCTVAVHFEPTSRDSQLRTKPMNKTLIEYLSHRPMTAQRSHFSVICVQDDLDTFKRLTGAFSIKFARHRINYFDWASHKPSKSANQITAQQTFFWPPQNDSINDVVRTAFGMEYLVSQPKKVTDDLFESGHQSYEHGAMNACVPRGSLQRLSVFVQVKTSVEGWVIERPDPNSISGGPFSIGNLMIVYDSMQNEVVSERVIPDLRSWSQIVDRKEGNVIQLAAIQLVFDTVAGKWSDYILFMHAYIVTLEQKIYVQSADDKRAPLLWEMSKQISEAETLLKFHIFLLGNVRGDLASFGSAENWLSPTVKEFKRLSGEVEESLRKPITHMVDLMYKSISIRDVRQSLELNTSMWRLSWITFIFLPLTFLAGFFGMNVDAFQHDPSLKWYFVSAAPLMILVLAAYMSAMKLMRKDADVSLKTRIIRAVVSLLRLLD